MGIGASCVFGAAASGAIFLAVRNGGPKPRPAASPNGRVHALRTAALDAKVERLFVPLGFSFPTTPARNQHLIPDSRNVPDLAVIVDAGNDVGFGNDESPVFVVVADPRVFDSVAGTL